MSIGLSTGLQAVAGATFTAVLAAPPAGLTVQLGARVEAPVSRAILSAWQPAAVTADGASVILDSPLRPGLYNLVWLTGDEPPQFEAFVPLSVIDPIDAVITSVEWPVVDEAQVRPEVDDVARLERSRTVEDSGNEAGTFTARTRPTATEVEDLIDQAVDDVLSQMRERIDPAHYRQVKRIIVYYTAMMVEGSFYREQVNERGAPLWQAEYREALAALNERIDQDLAQNNLLGTMEPRSSLLS